MLLAKQNTALTLIAGPILDSAGAEYTGAVIGDLSISKNGGSLTALASAATLTHIANGQYTLVLTTGNTDTLGAFQITCNKATYQMPMLERQVVPATVYDAIVTNAAGGANGLLLSLASNQVDLGKILGVAQSATDLKDFADTGYDPATHKVQGVVLTDTVTTYTGNTPQTGDSFARIGANGAGLTAADDAVIAAIAALNNLSAAQVNAEADTALADYDGPTNAEMEARTLVSASYATATALAAAKLILDHLATGIELDGSVYRFTANALELAPTGGATTFTAQMMAQLAGLRNVVGTGPLAGNLYLTENSVYLTTDGTQLQLPNSQGSWDLSDTDTITLAFSRTVDGTETTVTCSGAVIEDAGAGQQVDIEIPAVSSALLLRGEWQAQLWRVRAGNPYWLKSYKVYVTEDLR